MKKIHLTAQIISIAAVLTACFATSDEQITPALIACIIITAVCCIVMKLTETAQ